MYLTWPHQEGRDLVAPLVPFWGSEVRLKYRERAKDSSVPRHGVVLPTIDAWLSLQGCVSIPVEEFLRGVPWAHCSNGLTAKEPLHNTCLSARWGGYNTGHFPWCQLSDTGPTPAKSHVTTWAFSSDSGDRIFFYSSIVGHWGYFHKLVSVTGVTVNTGQGSLRSVLLESFQWHSEEAELGSVDRAMFSLVALFGVEAPAASQLRNFPGSLPEPLIMFAFINFYLR